MRGRLRGSVKEDGFRVFAFEELDVTQHVLLSDDSQQPPEKQDHYHHKQYSTLSYSSFYT